MNAGEFYANLADDCVSRNDDKKPGELITSFQDNLRETHIIIKEYISLQSYPVSFATYHQTPKTPSQ